MIIRRRSVSALVIAIVIAAAAFLATKANAAPFAFIDQITETLGLTAPKNTSESKIKPDFRQTAFVEPMKPMFFISGGGTITTFGGALTENFDSLATSGTANTWTDNSTISGMYAQFSASGQTSNPITYRASTGTDTTGAVYSFGIAGVGPVTDRAFGSVASATPGAIYYGFKFTNNTGSSISSLSISYTGEQWRDGGNNPANVAQSITLQYQVANTGTITDANSPTTGWTSSSPLSFTSPKFTTFSGALDGNAAANRTAISGTITFATPIGNGQEVWIRWEDLNDANNDHGLAIDDLSVTANPGALNGTYTVGAGKAFPTLTAAVAAYNANGVSGPVTFSLTDASYGSETYPITIGAATGSSASNTLTIKPAATKTPSFSTTFAGALISFNGASNVIIDGSNAGTTTRDLTIANSDTANGTIYINNSSSITVKNANVSGKANGGVGTINFNAAATSSNNTIQNCAITGSTTTQTYGILMGTFGGTGFGTNNTITGNTLSNNYVHIQNGGGFTGTTISNNTIADAAASTIFGEHGIIVQAGTGTSSINGNKISDFKNGQSGATEGIRLTTQAGDTINVTNNFVAIAPTFASTIYGIKGDGAGGTQNIYFNSVRVQALSGSTGYAFAKTTAYTGVAKDNIFHSASSSGAAIFVADSSTSLSSLTSDYNDLYATLGASVGTINATNYANLAAWQGAATGQDAHSVSADPFFTSTTDLHVVTSGAISPVNNVGTSIAGITTDYDGDTRNATTPDIGADEFTPPIPTVTGVSPTSGSILGGNVVTVTGTNLTGASAVDFGGSAGTSITNVTATSLQVTAPLHSAGTVDVRVTTPVSQSAVNAPGDQYTYTIAAPPNVTITGTSPTSPGQSQTPTVSGNNAGAANTVKLYTNALCTTQTGSSTTSAADGTWSIVSGTVAPNAITHFYAQASNAGGNSNCSTVFDYTNDIAAPAAPTFAQSTPNTPNSNLNPTINGTAENSSTVQLYLGSGCGTNGSATGSPQTANATTGAFGIAVSVSPNVTTVFSAKSTDAAGNSTCSTTTFSYVSYAAPAISTLNPPSGSPLGGTVITIAGSNFSAVASEDSVLIDGTIACPIVPGSVSSVEIQCTMPSHASGQVNVTVTAPGGVSNSKPFTYNDPVVSSISPTSGSSAGGTLVTVLGSNLFGVTKVTFDGVDGTNFGVDNDGQVHAKSPAHAVGTVQVAVVSAASTSNTKTFTYDPAAPCETASPSLPIEIASTGGTTTPTSYANLGAAFSAINAGTHQGSVQVRVCFNSTEPGSAVLNSSDASPASYTSINIHPMADGLTISGASAEGRGLIELNRADNVTIDGDNPNTAGTNRNLTITNTADILLNYTSVIRLAVTSAVDDSADNDTIQNLNLNGNAPGGNASFLFSRTAGEDTSFGILTGGKATGATTPPDPITTFDTGTMGVLGNAHISGFTASGNFVNACAQGMFLTGRFISDDRTITNNLIGDQSDLIGDPPYTTPDTTVYSRGIFVAGARSYDISGNSIRDISQWGGISQFGSPAGIYIAFHLGTGSRTIANNVINGTIANRGGNAYGILIDDPLPGTTPYSITGNTVTNVKSASHLSSSYDAGIETSSPFGTIVGNRVSSIQNGDGGGGAVGIHLKAGSSDVLKNNFIANVTDQFLNLNSTYSLSDAVFGIKVSAGTGHIIYHNSVHLSGTASSGSNFPQLAADLGILNASSTGMDVRNNILSNALTGGGGSSAFVPIYLPSGANSSMNLTLNNNAYYYAPSNTQQTGIGQRGTSPNTGLLFDLAALRAYSSTLKAGGTNDNASFESRGFAPFVSNTDLHIDTSVPRIFIESGGASVGVTTDIDGDTRPGPTNANGGGSAPDIGADEFDGIPVPQNDIAATLISSPTDGGSEFTGSTNQPVARFTNVGLATQSNVSVRFDSAGAGGYTYTDTEVIGSIAPGETKVVIFASTTYPVAGAYTMSANVATPDGFSGNDTITGNYSVVDHPTDPSGSGSANPNPVAAGSMTLMTVSVAPGTFPASTGITVTGNLAPIGGSATQAFADNGLNGDAVANDGVYSYLATVSPSTPPSLYKLTISVTDAQNRSGGATINVTVNAAPSITSISPDNGTTDGGTLVTVTGVNFTGATSVTFDGVAGTGFGVDSDTQVHAASPAHVAGPVQVAVVSGAITSNTKTFTYNDATLPGDKFRTKQFNEHWNSVLAWESSHDGTTWINATATPTFAADTILVQHTIFVTADVTVDQVTVASGTIICQGGNLTVADGTGTDLTVNDGGGIANLQPNVLIINGQASINGGVVTVNGDGGLIGTGSFSYSGASILQYQFVTTTGFEWPATNGPATVRVLGINQPGNLTSTLTLNGPKTVSTNVTLIRSNVDVTAPNTLTFSSGATINAELGTIIGTPVFQGVVSLSYTNGDGGDLTAGGELPTTPGTLQNLTVRNLAHAADSQGVGFPPEFTLILPADVTVGGTLWLRECPEQDCPIRVDTRSNTLTMAGTSLITQDTPNDYIIGNLKRNFDTGGPGNRPNAPEVGCTFDNFTFVVGTANGYSPVTACVNAAGGALTVSATDGTMPGLNGPGEKLARYWTITETPDVTADLTFAYPSTDHGGNFASYKFFKNEGGTVSMLAPASAPGDTSATINGVSNFSEWTLGEASALITDHTIVATSGAGGSITPSGNVVVTDGADQSFSIAPSDSCHYIADVLVDGVSVGQVASYMFSSVTTDHTISASFGTFGPFTINATAGAGGSILPSGAVSVPCGGDQDFTITPNPDSHIVDVTVDGSSQGAITSYTFNDVEQNHSIDATFATEPGTIAFDSATYSAFENETQVTITFNRVGGKDGTVSATWSTSDGTATDADNDYEPVTNGSVSFGPDDDTPKTFVITINDDSTYEADETFNVAVGPTVSSRPALKRPEALPVTAVVTIVNDDPVPAMLVVNTTSDTNDICTADVGGCSLREAINAANSDANDSSEITFDIPTTDGYSTTGHGHWTISPASALPPITAPVTIEGGGTPNMAANTDDANVVIEVSGANAGSGVDGFTFAPGSDGSELEGLAINSFTRHGVVVSTTGVEVIGNFIGTNITGTAAAANGGAGVYLDGAVFAMIGCTTFEERNIISGNGGAGVMLVNSSAINAIQGNFIGVAADGVTPLGNTQNGVQIGSVTVRPAPERRPNVTIIPVASGSSSNFIGAPLGIQQQQRANDLYKHHPRHKHTLRSNNIEADGDLIAGENVIANNGANGVDIIDTDATQNVIIQNSIHSNTGLGIDLGGDGVTANDDATDSDTGANNLQNFPVISSANASTQTITGTLDSPDTSDPAPGQPYTIEFFNNGPNGCDAFGNGEGKTSIGVDQTSFGGAFTVQLAANSFAPGDVITATATDPNGNTSEFSQCTTAGTSVDLKVTKTDSADPVNTGANVTYTIVVENKGLENATGTVMTDNLPASMKFVSATTSQGSLITPPVGSTGIVTANMGTIASQATGTVTITVQTTQAGVITNTATVSCTETDSDPSNNSDPEDTTVNSSASIGDRVWHDVNADGVQDMGETGINGLTVELLDNSSTVVATTTTLGDGDYTFSSFAAGTYSVRVTPPPGQLRTYDLDGTATANIATFNLGAGENRTDVDFGYNETPTIAINDVTATEGNLGTTDVQFTVTRTGATAVSWGATFNLNDGAPPNGATRGTCGDPGVDYEGPTGNFIIPANQSTATITIKFCGDTTLEPDETFTVDLSAPLNSTISDAQGVGTILNDECSALPSNLLSWYAGEDNANDNAFANQGSWTGAPAYAAGKVRRAFDFDGTSTMVTAPGTGSLNLTGDQMTMAGWIYPRTNDGGRFYFGRSASSDHPYVLYNNGGKVFVIVSSDSGDNQEFDTGFVPPVNTWTHLAMTYNGSSGSGLTVYANGVPVFSNSSTTGNLRSSTLPFAIGNRATDPAVSFNGVIDEVEIFDRELTGAQVGAIATSGSAGQCPALSINDHVFNGFDTKIEAVDEGFTVTLIGGTDQTVTTSYRTVDGTAKAGSDYVGVLGSLAFDPSPGSQQKFVPVHIIDDNVQENDETFTMIIGRQNGATLYRSIGVGTIHSGDPGPSFAISDASVVEGNSGTTTATFTITKTGATSLDSGVQVTTSDGTATEADNDYVGKTQFISFLPAETSKTFTVTVNGDTTFEPDETFNVTMTSGFNSTITDGDAVGTILNDECTPMPGGMVAWWNGQDNANDIVGAANGSVVGDTMFVTGKVGKAFKFDGTGDEVQFSTNSSLNLQDLTIDAWIRVDARSLASIVDVRPGGYDFGLYGDAPFPGGGTGNGAPQAGNLFLSHQGIDHVYSNLVVPTDGQFHHIAVTRSGSTVIFYLDGVASTPVTYNASFSLPANGYLGSGLNGSLDEIEIFNRALDQNEISTLATASGAGKCHTSTLQFSASDFPVNENVGSPTTVTLSRVGAHDTAASVDVAISDGTATSGDYSATTPVTISFAAGESSKPVAGITVQDDGIYENAETVNLALSGPTGSGVALGSQTSATMTITDNDSAPTLAINDVTFSGADSRPEVLSGFTVTLTGATEVYPVTVHYKSSDGTATAPSDYGAVEGDLTFNAGETTKPISVSIVGDNVEEPTENFFINLSDPVNAAFGDNQGIGTIPNDDTSVVSIGDASDFEGNSGTKTFAFPVSLTNPVSTNTTVYYSTGDGSATEANNDYEGVQNGSIVIQAGQTSGTINITVNGDTDYEPDETFDVTISLFSNVCATNCRPDRGPEVNVGNATGVGTIKNDDCLVDPIVTNTNDSGPGSLRDYVAAACSGSNITFNLSGGGPHTIDLLTPLVIPSKNLTITGPTGVQVILNGTIQTGMPEGAQPDKHVVVIVEGPTQVSEKAPEGAPLVTMTDLNITGGGNPQGCGGGIVNDHANLVLDRMAIYNNTASQGAGVCNFGTVSGSASVTIRNSTISNNVATGEGGGLSNQGQNSGQAEMNLINVTIAANTATAGAGLYNYGFNAGTGLTTIKNTIFANGSTGGNIASSTVAGGGSGDVDSQGFNLADDNGGGFLDQATDKLNTDPLLGPLVNNGGSTLTRALLNGSPAIDKGGAVVPPLTIDQRGSTRPVEFTGINNAVGGNGSDIGAFEVQQPTAGEVSISGRVRTADGRGITNATVTVSGGSLVTPIAVVTGRSGSYAVSGLEVGQTYVVTVGSQRFTFTRSSRVVDLADNAVDIDFTASP